MAIDGRTGWTSENPGYEAGEIVVVQMSEAEPAPRTTLMEAKTPEKRAAIVERLRGLARELRAEYGDDLPSLHRVDGLPDARL